MDSNAFDAFIRALTIQRPRRAALQLLGGASLAAIAARGLGESGVAKKKRKKNGKKKDRCRNGKTSCRGSCLEPGLVCCPFSTDGLDGVCTPSHPVCCPLDTFGGCCPADFPVCCASDCCAAGETCDEDGECVSSN